MKQFILALLSRSQLWAIRPEAVACALAALEPDAVSNPIKWEAAQPSTRGNGANKIAVVPIQGVLTKDGPAWYGSNYDRISSAVSSAAADPEVKHIVLHVDSPGGEVMGCAETGAVIARAAKVKPVTAMVDGQATSAAYWLASQARNITLTPSGEVGSVGVRMMHVDVSKNLEDNGVKITELHAGAYKTEFSPYSPLTPEAAEKMQTRLDSTHQEFMAAVNAGRGTRATQEMRDGNYGEARVFSSGDAMGHGLVDAVLSSREFYSGLAPQEPETAPSFPTRGRAQAAIAVSRERTKV